MIKAIIVDDETGAIESMKWELENFCKDVHVVSCFTDPHEALIAINNSKPDCVFLDIEMPSMDGFTLINNLAYRDFALVITTAYEDYALKAFRENAIDYLMKPIDSDDLVICVERVRKVIGSGDGGKSLERLLKSLTGNRTQDKIALHQNGKIIYQKLSEVLYCEADGNYTTVFTVDEKKIVVSKKLKDIEASLEGNSFCRVHQSYLVNTGYVREFVRTDGQYLLLENGINIPVSRAKKAEVIAQLEQL